MKVVSASEYIFCDRITGRRSLWISGTEMWHHISIYANSPKKVQHRQPAAVKLVVGQIVMLRRLVQLRPVDEKLVFRRISALPEALI